MIFSDHELARRLEGLESRFAAECAQARREIHPGRDTVALAVAGGFALYLGDDSPLIEAKGLGMAGPVSPEELEAMERVFHYRGVTAKVMVCPMADPSLLEGLAARGYRPAGFEDVLYRELGRGRPAAAPRGRRGGLGGAGRGRGRRRDDGPRLRRRPRSRGRASWRSSAIAARVPGLTSLLAGSTASPPAWRRS